MFHLNRISLVIVGATKLDSATISLISYWLQRAKTERPNHSIATGPQPIKLGKISPINRKIFDQILRASLVVRRVILLI